MAEKLAVDVSCSDCNGWMDEWTEESVGILRDVCDYNKSYCNTFRPWSL